MAAECHRSQREGYTENHDGNLAFGSGAGEEEVNFYIIRGGKAIGFRASLGLRED